MNTLIGYASSDEEDGNDAQQSASKIPTTGPGPQHDTVNPSAVLEDKSPPEIVPQLATPEGPAPGPSIPSAEDDNATDPPLSPYSYERQKVLEATMPEFPNFDIPNSPSPPPNNSEEAATLAATTKKFERFLELKKQGIHFNDRLQNTKSMRNPGILPKLMAFAGITEEESYATTLPAECQVPTRLPESNYIESLLKANEKAEKKRKAERDKIDFVPSKSAASSKSNTPGTGREHRKSRFD